LIENLNAVAVLADHIVQATNLPLNAAQSSLDEYFSVEVTGCRHVNLLEQLYTHRGYRRISDGESSS
jgi:hypothetical protein